MDDSIECEEIVVVLSGFGRQLKVPALHYLFVAEVGHSADQHAEQVMPDRHRFRYQEERVEQHEPGDESVDCKVQVYRDRLDALLVLLG